VKLKSALLALALAASGCPKPGDDVDPKIRAEGHYVAGQSAYLKGDFEEAHKQFAEVKKLNPSDPRLPVAEGEVYLSEVKIAEAIEHFETAVKADPKRGTTWSRLGYLYSVKNEKQKAREALDKALAANPKDYNALETLGDLQLDQGQVDEGVKNLLAASELAPEATRGDMVLRAVSELEKRGKADQVLGVLEGAVKKGVKTPGVLSELGDGLVEAGRFEEALVAYGDAAKADAKDPSLWELVGEVQLKLGRAAEAEAAFKKSLEVKDRGVVHVALAKLCLSKKDEGCAKVELDKALSSSTGEEVRETVELGELLAAMGRKKDALELLRTLSEEGDQKANFDLHLRTARLAKELKDEVTLKAACTRALAGGQAGLKCP
jgi:tetratricopeptide (TPR) repeat protein